LYVGPVVLRSFLSPSFYDHFIMLHFAVYSFLDEELCTKYFEQASACIRAFVEQAKELYTADCLVYNTHILSHIPHFVKIYGPLHQWSSFPFEAFIHDLKKRIRSPHCILPQLCNRIHELWNWGIKSSVNDIQFSTEFSDSCVLTITGVCVLLFRTGCRLDGYEMAYKKDLYSAPYPSSSLGIGVYEKTTSVLENIIVKKKCICYPLSNGSYIVIPFASTSSFY
jgi:hypothetical protein